MENLSVLLNDLKERLCIVSPCQKLPLDLTFCIYFVKLYFYQRKVKETSGKSQRNLISDVLFCQTCFWFIPLKSSLHIFIKNLLLVSCLLDMWRKTKCQEKYLVLLQEYLVKLRPNIKNFPVKWKVTWNGNVRIQILNEVFKIHVAEDDFVEIVGVNHILSSMLSGHN